MDTDDTDEESRSTRRFRITHSREATKKYALYIVEKLLDLDEETDPEGRDTAEYPGKGHKAHRALRLAGELSTVLAGWAIAHQTGRALEGKGYMPLYYPDAVRQTPDYREARKDADSHKHEEAGCDALLSEAEIPGPVLRQYLANILPLISVRTAGQSTVLTRQISDALRRAQSGELSPFFDLPKTLKWSHPYSRQQLMLRACEHHQYRVFGWGMQSKAAWEDVADAYGRSFDTVRGWPSLLRSEMGDLKVSKQLSMAKDWALSYRGYDVRDDENDDVPYCFPDPLLSNESLVRDGADFRSLGPDDE